MLRCCIAFVACCRCFHVFIYLSFWFYCLCSAPCPDHPWDDFYHLNSLKLFFISIISTPLTVFCENSVRFNHSIRFVCWYWMKVKCIVELYCLISSCCNYAPAVSRKSLCFRWFICWEPGPVCSHTQIFNLRTFNLRDVERIDWIKLRERCNCLY